MQDSKERYIDLTVMAEHRNGTDVPLPTIRLHLDSQWRRMNGRGRKEEAGGRRNAESSQMFGVVSLLNQLKQKWKMQNKE